MAKLAPHSPDPRFYCRYCNGQHDVQIEQQPQNAPYSGYNQTLTITRFCSCEQFGERTTNFSIDYSKATEKETKVAKQFDTTEVKNTALNTIQSSIDKLERALFDKAHAIREVEIEHNKRVANASIALDRVLMEALQNDVDANDYSIHLPEYEDALTERVAALIELTQLVNTEELV
jgi:hypothetical protein